MFHSGNEISRVPFKGPSRQRYRIQSQDVNLVNTFRYRFCLRRKMAPTIREVNGSVLSVHGTNTLRHNRLSATKGPITGDFGTGRNIDCVGK